MRLFAGLFTRYIYFVRLAQDVSGFRWENRWIILDTNVDLNLGNKQKRTKHNAAATQNEKSRQLVVNSQLRYP